jgi:hypothetical protein
MGFFETGASDETRVLPDHDATPRADDRGDLHRGEPRQPRDVVSEEEHRPANLQAINQKKSLGASSGASCRRLPVDLHFEQLRREFAPDREPAP